MAEMVDTPCGKECAALNEVQARLKSGDEILKMIPQIAEDIKHLKKTDEQVREVVAAWENFGGFLATMSALKNFAFIMTPIIVLIAVFGWLSKKIGII